MVMSKISNTSTVQSIAGLQQRCELALELLHTHRGNCSVEVDRVLADDAAARSTLTASLTAIEAASADSNEPARRHADAARAWLEGSPGLAAERYGAIVVDWPGDILALVVAHGLDFRLGQRRMLRDRIAQVLP